MNHFTQYGKSLEPEDSSGRKCNNFLNIVYQN